MCVCCAHVWCVCVCVVHMCGVCVCVCYARVWCVCVCWHVWCVCVVHMCGVCVCVGTCGVCVCVVHVWCVCVVHMCVCVVHMCVCVVHMCGVCVCVVHMCVCVVRVCVLCVCVCVLCMSVCACVGLYVHVFQDIIPQWLGETLALYIAEHCMLSLAGFHGIGYCAYCCHGYPHRNRSAGCRRLPLTSGDSCKTSTVRWLSRVPLSLTQLTSSTNATWILY